MEKVYKKARAKINLILNIVNKREDNYHNIESIFQKISLYDEIYITKSKKDGIHIKSNVQSLQGKENIIFKAYEMLKKRFKNICGIDVVLKKNIPMEAGLGGGSTDCGTFIECMNILFDLNLSIDEMKEIGVCLGADVPAAFYEKPIVVEGIGEKIREIDSNLKCYVIIVSPNFSCNTKEMYEKIDNTNELKQKYNLNKMKVAIEKNDVKKVADSLYNVFEEVSKDEIKKIKEKILECGALGSLMTGSGSAVYRYI